MEKQPDNSLVSQLVISDDVIASVAMNAVKDIDGVGKIVHRPKDIRSVAEMFEGALKYVEVYSNEKTYTIKLHITIKDGEKIPVVAAQVQKAVKNAVQGMTGCVVSKVNVSVADVEITEKRT